MTKAMGFPLRLDMSRPRAEGYKAFMEGEDKTTCPYKWTDPKASEWRAGYEKARENKEKRDVESYH
jgi:ribosome modulation factor